MRCEYCGSPNAVDCGSLNFQCKERCLYIGDFYQVILDNRSFEVWIERFDSDNITVGCNLWMTDHPLTITRTQWENGNPKFLRIGKKRKYWNWIPLKGFIQPYV